MRTYPHVIAYGNRQGIFQPPVSLLYIEGVTGCVKSAVGSNEHIVAELDFCLIQDNAIHVCIKIPANLYVIAVITKKRLLYQKTTSRLPKQFDYNIVPAFGF